MISKETLFSIPFVSDSEAKFIELIKKLVRNEDKCFIVTANPEIVMKTKEDPEYKKIVLSADFVIPDGIGVVKASSMLGKPVTERITGFDTMMQLLAFANDEKKRVYLLGATQEVVTKAVENAKKKYPSMDLCGYHNGFFTEEEGNDIAKEIENLAPDMVFVALGYPKQEQFISRLLPHMSKGVFMGVGGCFDIMAGNVKRAPDWMIASNLEWLYRISSSPSRIKRSVSPLVRFSLMTMKEMRKK